MEFLVNGSDVLRVGFSVFFIAVNSRECFGCTSRISLEDCVDKRTIVKCKNNSQPCAEFSAYTLTGEREEFYLKGCAQTCSVSGIEICADPNEVKCALSCCSSDLCNGLNKTSSPTPGKVVGDVGVSGPGVSGLLLIVTASFIYLFRF